MSTHTIKRNLTAEALNSKMLSPGMVIDNKGHSMVVMVHAPWCGHCKNFKPVFQEAADLDTGIVFGDIEDPTAPFSAEDKATKELMQALDIKGFPTFLLYDGKGNRVPDRGKINRADAVSFIKSLKAIFASVEGFEPKTPRYVKPPLDVDHKKEMERVYNERRKAMERYHHEKKKAMERYHHEEEKEHYGMRRVARK